MSNLPEFDPLNPTKEEMDEMVTGYLDGWRGNPVPSYWITSAAYDHGRRNGVNDKLGISEDWQRTLARRMMTERAK